MLTQKKKFSKQTNGFINVMMRIIHAENSTTKLMIKFLVYEKISRGIFLLVVQRRRMRMVNLNYTRI